MIVPPRVVVLVEGHSDAVALRVLCDRAGLTLGDGRVEIRNMHGVTNVARQLSQLDQHHLPRRHPGVGVRVLGLCDAPERRFVARALRARGVALESDDELSRWGFEVCDRDLEDELVRALGPERVVGVLDELGERERFRAFQRQPQWRDRDVHDQLRRFAGTHSGRKALLAERLAAALDPGAEPVPLARLVAEIEHSVGPR